MALPFAPIAGVALRYGAVALATYVAARNLPVAHRDQRAEDALDDVGEGAALRREPGEIAGHGRMRRVFRVRGGGPAVEIDAAGFGRIRMRRL